MANSLLIEWLSITDAVFAGEHIFQSSLPCVLVSSGLFTSSRKLSSLRALQPLEPGRLRGAHCSLRYGVMLVVWMDAGSIATAAAQKLEHLVLVGSGLFYVETRKSFPSLQKAPV